MVDFQGNFDGLDFEIKEQKGYGKIFKKNAASFLKLNLTQTSQNINESEAVTKIYTLQLQKKDTLLLKTEDLKNTLQFKRKE